MRKLIGLFALLSALGLLCLAATGAFATESAATEEGASTSEAAPAGEAAPLTVCDSGYVCVYTGIDFTGAQGTSSCGAEGAHPLGGSKSSAQNHCPNRAVFIRVNGNAVSCMNGNGQIEHYEFNEIYIAAPGSHC